MNSNPDIKKFLEEHNNVFNELMHESNQIEKTVDALIGSIQRGCKILICGNGGSAADAQHFAAELIGKFKKERDALPAIALTTNTSVITAIANDSSFEQVFSRQVEALAQRGDVLVGISTSGNSKDVVEALITAKKKGCKTIGLTGEGGGKMKDYCDILIEVNSKNTPRIQEAHIFLIHVICELLEQKLFD